MSEHIIILIIIALLWYHFTEPRSRLINENTCLKNQCKILKTRVKYLEKYKNDVSKTFKILDNELVMINDHIKRQQEPNTPNILNNLFGDSTTNSFNSMFNRFLTSDIQEQQELPQELQEQPQEQPQELEPQPIEPQETQELMELLINYVPLNSQYRKYLLN